MLHEAVRSRDDNPFLATPRRLQKKTRLAGLERISTTELLRRSYEQVRLAGGFAFPSEGWDVALVAQHDESGPSYELLRVRDQLSTRILGRHENTTLDLANDSALSLRHVLCVFNRSQAGAVVTRVVDLSSSLGVFSAGEARHRSLAMCASMALRMGNTSLFVVYRADLEGQPMLPPWDVMGFCSPKQTQGLSPVERELGIYPEVGRHVDVGPRRPAAITLVGLPDDRWRMPRSAKPSGDEAVSAARLHFGSGAQAVVLRLSAERLRAGCLIGRDLRCHINSRDANLTNAISRVHAMLLEVDGRPVLIDIASTNGIYVDGRAQKVFALSLNEPTVIDLSRGEQVMTFHPQRHQPIQLGPMRRGRPAS